MVTYQEYGNPAGPMEEHQDDFLLAPHFLMRVTGLPFSALQQMQFPRSLAYIEELLQIEAWQNEHSDILQDELRDALKMIEDKKDQHKGLDLRRAMVSHNGQKAQVLLSLVAPHLSEALIQMIETWCQHTIRRTELLAIGEGTLQEEVIENRIRLHQLFLNEDFQHGLLLSSDTLYSELQNYLRTPVEQNNNRVRRTEEGLLSYFVRMATKTSPYSTFCSTALGTWSDQKQQPSQLRIKDWRQQRSTRLNSQLFSTITQMLFKRPEIRPYLFLSLNSTLHWIADNPANPMNNGKIEILLQEKIKARKYNYDERLVRLRPNPLIRTIITTLEEDSTWTYKQLLDHIVDSFLSQNTDWDEKEGGCQQREQERQQAAQKVTTTLEHLVSHAVVALDLRIPAHENDKLLFLIQRLKQISGTWVAEIRQSLEQMHDLTITYGYVAIADSARILKELRDQAIRLCREIGALQNPPYDPTENVNKLYPSLIMEDATLPYATPTLDRLQWEPVLHDLRVLQELAPLLDVSMVEKMHMDRWAKESLPQAEDFITFYLRFWQEFMPHRDLQQQRRRTEPNFVHLQECRQAFITQLSQQMQQAQGEHVKILQLDPTEIHRFTQGFPTFMQPQATLAYFGQFFLDQDDPQMVLNATWTGPGTTFSRFSHLFQPIAVLGSEDTVVGKTFAEVMQVYITELGKRHNTIYASIAETGDINVNTHGLLTPYEILFPFSTSQHLKNTQLPLSDLYAMFHEQKQEFQIFSHKLNAQIKPLHLGFSLIQMMPPLYQALVTTTTHYPIFDMVMLLETRLKAEQKMQIRHYPRVVLGHVVLNRECWKVPVKMIPQREPGENAFDYFLKVNRWRLAVGLPTTCFRRIISDTGNQTSPHLPASAQQYGEQNRTEDISAEENSVSSKTRTETQRAPRPIAKTLSKPFYVDFHNYFLLSLLNAVLKSLPHEMTLTFEEVLPTPEQHLLKEDQQSYATECILELSR